jgi:hypothetical protein
VGPIFPIQVTSDFSFSVSLTAQKLCGVWTLTEIPMCCLFVQDESISKARNQLEAGSKQSNLFARDSGLYRKSGGIWEATCQFQLAYSQDTLYQ